MVLHALILALRGFRTESLRVVTVTQWNHISNKQTKKKQAYKQNKTSRYVLNSQLELTSPTPQDKTTVYDESELIIRELIYRDCEEPAIMVLM